MKQNYRPIKSEQLFLQSLVQKSFKNEKIVVHHVFESSHRKLWFQIERRTQTQIIFERILIEED